MFMIPMTLKLRLAWLVFSTIATFAANSAMQSVFGPEEKEAKTVEVKPAVATPEQNVQKNTTIIIDGVVVSREEYDAIWYTNWYRQQVGRRPLKVSKELMDKSRQWARNMANRESMTHDPNGGRENIAVGQRDAREVTKAWNDSPGHRQNMLSNTTHMGVAVVTSRSGRRYWCQRFNNQAQVR